MTVRHGYKPFAPACHPADTDLPFEVIGLKMPLSNTLPARITSDFLASEELVKRDDIAIPQFYEFHEKHNPNYPVFLYHDGEKLQYITYATANRAIDRAARYIGSKVGVNHKHAGNDKPVVGILANAGEVLL